MSPPPRWVLDTNVLVSAFLWRGAPGRLLESAGEGDILLMTSATLLDELAATLTKKKLAKYVAATGLSAEQICHSYRRIAQVVPAPDLPQPVARDVDDDAVLACALACRADLIVTGDDDLLVLKHFVGIPIVTVAQALNRT